MHFTPQALPGPRDQVQTNFWVLKSLEDSITPQQVPLLQISCRPFIPLPELVAWMTMACLVLTAWALDMIKLLVFQSPTLWSVTQIQWPMFLVMKIICSFSILISSHSSTSKQIYRVLLIASWWHTLRPWPMVKRRGDGESCSTFWNGSWWGNDQTRDTGN